MSYTSFSSLARSSFTKSGKWATGIGAIGGFTADVLNPLGPFAGYLALVALAVAALLALATLFRLLAADRGVPAIVFALITCVVTGGIYSLQKSQDAENGIIAKLVPAVSQMQESLGLIAAKVDKIDKTVSENLAVTKQVQETAEAVQKQGEETQKQTAEVKQTTEEIKKQTEDVKQQGAETQKQTAEVKQQTEVIQQQTEEVKKQTTEIAAAVEEIAAGFKTLGSQGGVIANPERPDQFYHNARIHELGGDVLNARQAYVGFARFNVDAVDAYARFATLLKVSEGRAGAREVLGAMRETNKTKSLELVWTQLLDESQRTAALEKFAKANPDFGPAQFALSEEFSEDRLGERSLSQKRAEKTALDAFLAAEKSGGLVKYFVDQTALAEWAGRAQTRLTALGDLDAFAAPTISPMRAGAGWQVTVSLPEPATALSWRMKNVGQFVDTGTVDYTDPRTGKKMVNPSFQLPGDASAGEVELKYVDLRGQENGPFTVAFNPDAALIASQKMMVEQTWTSWIAFDASGFRGNLYFTQLATFSCGIKDVKYGFNGAAPTETLKLPPCDPAKPFEMPYDFQPYFKVGEDVKSMTVEVTYADGTTSGVKDFRRQ